MMDVTYTGRRGEAGGGARFFFFSAQMHTVKGVDLAGLEMLGKGSEG